MWQFSTQISQTTGIGDEEYGFKINLVMHTAGMIERIIRNEPLTVEENELTNTTNDPLYSQLAASVVLLEDQIKVKVPIEEMYYLLRLVHNQLDKRIHCAMNTQKRYTFIVYRFCVLVKNPLNSISVS